MNNIAAVVKIIDEYTIAINQGINKGIKENDIFLIFYKTSEEIVDPTTKEVLGYLEIPIGKGKIISVQEKMSILKAFEKSESIKTTTIEKNNFINFAATEKTTIEPGEIIPFTDVQVGYYAKKI